MKRLQIPQILVHGKFYGHEKILRTRNCRRKFIKNLLPAKMQRKYVNQTIAIQIAIEPNNSFKDIHFNTLLSFSLEVILVMVISPLTRFILLPII